MDSARNSDSGKHSSSLSASCSLTALGKYAWSRPEFQCKKYNHSLTGWNFNASKSSNKSGLFKYIGDHFWIQVARWCFHPRFWHVSLFPGFSTTNSCAEPLRMDLKYWYKKLIAASHESDRHRRSNSHCEVLHWLFLSVFWLSYSYSHQH